MKNLQIFFEKKITYLYRIKYKNFQIFPLNKNYIPNIHYFRKNFQNFPQNKN